MCVRALVRFPGPGRSQPVAAGTAGVTWPGARGQRASPLGDDRRATMGQERRLRFWRQTRSRGGRGAQGREGVGPLMLAAPLHAEEHRDCVAAVDAAAVSNPWLGPGRSRPLRLGHVVGERGSKPRDGQAVRLGTGR